MLKTDIDGMTKNHYIYLLFVSYKYKKNNKRIKE